VHDLHAVANQQSVARRHTQVELVSGGCCMDAPSKGGTPAGTVGRTPWPDGSNKATSASHSCWALLGRMVLGQKRLTRRFHMVEWKE
jgi:hypothetical protein